MRLPSVNMTLRKVTRHHRIFLSDEAVYKVVYLAMRKIAKKWVIVPSVLTKENQRQIL
jgi:putative transposase